MSEVSLSKWHCSQGKKLSLYKAKQNISLLLYHHTIVTWKASLLLNIKWNKEKEIQSNTGRMVLFQLQIATPDSYLKFHCRPDVFFCLSN